MSFYAPDGEPTYPYTIEQRDRALTAAHALREFYYEEWSKRCESFSNRYERREIMDDARSNGRIFMDEIKKGKGQTLQRFFFIKDYYDNVAEKFNPLWVEDPLFQLDEYDIDLNLILAIIGKAGKSGINASSLSRETPKMPGRRRSNILLELREAGEITITEIHTGHRPMIVFHKIK